MSFPTICDSYFGTREYFPTFIIIFSFWEGSRYEKLKVAFVKEILNILGTWRDKIQSNKRYLSLLKLKKR